LRSTPSVLGSEKLNKLCKNATEIYTRKLTHTTMRLISWWSILHSCIVTSAFPQEGRGGSSLRRTRNTPRFLTISDSSAGSKTGPNKVDAFKPPGPWSISGPLARECSQPDLPRQSFTGHSGHVAEPT